MIRKLEKSKCKLSYHGCWESVSDGLLSQAVKKKIENGLKGGKNISATRSCASCATFSTFVFPHFLRHLLSFPDGRIENRNLFFQLTQIRFQLDIDGNPQILRFCLTSILTGPKRFAPLFQPIKPRTKTNLLRFPALEAFCVSLLGILISSSWYFSYNWLAAVIS